jgi:hypothetical protein
MAGALPIGLGIATPLFAAIGRTTDPGRGAAIAVFIKPGRSIPRRADTACLVRQSAEPKRHCRLT